MHFIRARYFVKLRTGARRAVFPAAAAIEGNVYEFRPGWQLTGELGGIYAGEGAMVTCDPAYPADAPTWLPTGDLLPAADEHVDLVEQAK